MAASRTFMSRFRESVALAALLALSTPAFAQAGGSAEGAAQEAEADAASAGGLQEIIITAERRAENLQKSSLAIQVLTDEEIVRSGITQSTDLNSMVPGLQIGTGGNATQIYIRGVGDFAASALSNPAVAVNIDGVYVSRPQAVNSLFYDVARIEVLKGPQGTLYGRNASGGAINIITNRPSLRGVEGFLLGELGNYDLKHVQGALNVPLGSTAAARASFQVVDRDGYLSDGTDDDSRQAGRLRLLWQPSSAVELILNADYAHEGGNGPGYVLLPRPDGLGKWDSASEPEANAVLTATPPLGFLIPPVGRDTFRDNDFWNLSAELNWDVGFATLTLLPAYRDVKLSERNYPAGLRNTIPEATSKQTSIEARLAAVSGPADWVIGAYYIDEDQKAEQQIYQGILQDNLGFYEPSTTSYAAFGQITYSVAETLRLIAGGRYTHEKRSLEGAIFTNSPTAAPPPYPALLEEFGGEHSWSKFTWKAGAEYDLSPRNMLFFTASTGFKAGGFNQTVPPMDIFEPEKLLAFELGSRNRFLDGRLQLNVELFHWTYKDNQIAHVIFDPLGVINLVTHNAGRAKIKGANVDVVAKLGPNTTLRGFVEYNDAKYREFQYDTAFSIFGSPLFNPASTACEVSAPFAGPVFGTMLATIDCSGFRLPRTPKWSGAVGLTHEVPLGNGGTIIADASAQFASQRWLSFEFVEPQRADGYVLLDFDLSYEAPNRRWSIAGFVRNITKEAVYSGGGVQSFAPPLTYATIAAPRTYGVRLRYNFGE
jgi:iron complex outermembrane receptor protein